MRRSWNRAACGRRIGKCGYTSVPEDGRTCSCVAWFCCVECSFFSTNPRYWLERTSPKWPILCRVGRKTFTQPSMELYIYFDPSKWAKYCDKRLCLSVCLSVCLTLYVSSLRIMLLYTIVSRRKFILHTYYKITNKLIFRRAYRAIRRFR